MSLLAPLRRVGTTFGAALVAAFAATIVSAFAAPADSATRTLELTLTDIETFDVDSEPEGDSAGDTFGFVERATSRGKKVGRALGTCTLVTEEEAHCTITLLLHGGRIDFQGAIPLTNAPRTLAVVGGTGRYASARGSAKVEPRTSLASSSGVLTVRLR